MKKGTMITWREQSRPLAVSGKVVILSTREILEEVNAGGIKCSRDIGNLILDMLPITGADLDGEDSKSNFALAMFEKAMDWRIGLWVTDWMQAKFESGYHSRVIVSINNTGMYDAITGKCLTKF